MNLRFNINPKNILESFKKWFKENESDLIWNEQAQGYDSNNDINLCNLSLSFIPIQFNMVRGNFNYSYNKVKFTEEQVRSVCKVGGNIIT